MRERRSDIFLGEWRLFNNWGQPTQKVIFITDTVNAGGTRSGGWTGMARSARGDLYALNKLAQDIHNGVLRRM